MSNGTRRRLYAAQEMLTTYQSGQSVGDVYGQAVARRNMEGGDVGALATAAAGFVASMIGLGMSTKAAKKSREHELEALTLQNETAAINSQGAALNLQAAADLSAAGMARAKTYALYGAGTVVTLAVIGGGGYLAIKQPWRKGKK